MRERERDSERNRDKETKRQRERERCNELGACVYVCICDVQHSSVTVHQERLLFLNEILNIAWCY